MKDKDNKIRRTVARNIGKLSEIVMRRKRKIPNETTLQVIKDIEEGKNLVGPFETVEELFESLESEDDE